MNPKHGPAFFAIAFALMTPFMAFLMYVIFDYPPGQWPDWVGHALTALFAAGTLGCMLLMTRKVGGFRSQEAVAGLERVRGVRAIIQIFNLYLLLLAIGALAYCVRLVIVLQAPLNYALPAVAFVLIWVAAFGWSLYKSTRRAT